MVNKSNVQARKLDIAKIRLLYGRVCFMVKKWFALWTGLLYGQKVVCFMGPAHKARTKSGLLYGQQISANPGKNPPHSPRFGP